MSNGYSVEPGSAYMGFEQLVPKRSEQLLQLQAFENSPYTKNAREVAHHLTDTILEFPHYSHVIGALGGPDEGKTTFERQVARYVLRPGGRVANFVQQIGGGVRVDVIPWRANWKGFHTVDELPPNYPDKKEKQAEIDLVSDNLSRGLVNTVRRYFQYPDEVLGNEEKDRYFVEYGTKAPLIHLVLFDAPPISGVTTKDGQVGIVRAENVIRNLASRSGEFKGLNYTFTGIGMAASPAVRKWGIETRALTTSVDESKKKEALLSRGVVIHGEGGVDINEYVREGASPAEISELESDMIDTLLYLTRTKRIELPDNYELTRSQLEANSTLRYYLIGKGLIPWVFQHRLGIFPYQGAILDNNTVYPVIDVPYDLDDEHDPMSEIYATKPSKEFALPDIQGRVNDEINTQF